MTPSIKSKQNNLQKANQLLVSIKKANTDFVQKTDILVKDINHDIDEAEAEMNKTDKELKDFEKDTVNKIDKAVEEFLSEE